MAMESNRWVSNAEAELKSEEALGFVSQAEYPVPAAPRKLHVFSWERH